MDTSDLSSRCFNQDFASQDKSKTFGTKIRAFFFSLPVGLSVFCSYSSLLVVKERWHFISDANVHSSDCWSQISFGSVSDPHSLPLLHLFHLFPSCFPPSTSGTACHPSSSPLSTHAAISFPSPPLWPVAANRRFLSSSSSSHQRYRFPSERLSTCLLTVAPSSIYERSNWELWDDGLTRVLSLKLQPAVICSQEYTTPHIVTLLVYYSFNCATPASVKHWVPHKSMISCALKQRPFVKHLRMWPEENDLFI